jgi:DNA-binding transcriptional ArsR family regulator
MILGNLEQVKALADPLRLRIMHAMQPAPLTTKQIAHQIGEKPAKLYYHVEALANLGLIALVETRAKRGTVEKYYRAVAKRFLVGHDLLMADGGAPRATNELQAVVASFLESTRTELMASLAHGLLEPDADCLPAVLSRGYVRATSEKIRELSAKLHAWLEECQMIDQHEATIQFGLSVVFYPVVGSAAQTEEDYDPGIDHAPQR